MFSKFPYPLFFSSLVKNVGCFLLIKKQEYILCSFLSMGPKLVVQGIGVGETIIVKICL